MSKLPAKTLENMHRAIRQPAHVSGMCQECNGSGFATIFSDFPCATCGGSGFVDANEDEDESE